MGRFVGITEHQGDILTYLILTDDTLQVNARSTIRSALGPENKNLCASTDAGVRENGSDKPIVMYTNDLAVIPIEPSALSLPDFSPDELLGQTYLREMEDERWKMGSANACQSIQKDYGHGHGQSSGNSSS